ncbi:MAG: glycogen synthase, partial [Terriglobales bacterium]
MRVALFTREYPPHVYGGAGVHVDYLSRELARSIDVEVHCFGEQHSSSGQLTVIGHEPCQKLTTEEKFRGALQA